MPQPSITNIDLKITCLKFHSNLPGANELNKSPECVDLFNFVEILIFFLVFAMWFWAPSMNWLWCSEAYAIIVLGQHCSRQRLVYYLRQYWLAINETILLHINILRPRQNGRHFADDIFKCIFLNENVRISIEISLKFVLKESINNIPALVQIMAWCRPGDKPLSEPIMVSLLTHICITRPQWVMEWNYEKNANDLLHKKYIGRCL